MASSTDCRTLRGRYPDEVVGASEGRASAEAISRNTPCTLRPILEARAAASPPLEQFHGIIVRALGSTPKIVHSINTRVRQRFERLIFIVVISSLISSGALHSLHRFGFSGVFARLRATISHSRDYRPRAKTDAIPPCPKILNHIAGPPFNDGDVWLSSSVLERWLCSASYSIMRSVVKGGIGANEIAILQTSNADRWDDGAPSTARSIGLALFARLACLAIPIEPVTFPSASCRRRRRRW